MPTSYIGAGLYSECCAFNLGKETGDGLHVLVLAAHREDLEEAPSSWIWPCPSLANVAVWKVKQQMKDLCFVTLSNKLIKKNSQLLPNCTSLILHNPTSKA